MREWKHIGIRAVLVAMSFSFAAHGQPLELSAAPASPGDSADALILPRPGDGFRPFLPEAPPRQPGAHWIRVSGDTGLLADLPALVVHAARSARIEVFVDQGGQVRSAPLAAQWSTFRGSVDRAYIVSERTPASPLLLKLDGGERGLQELRITSTTLPLALARGAEQARMVELAFGALAAMALAALLIWLVLKDRLFVLYGSLFLLQSLYLAYLTGPGFDWPWLSAGLRFGTHAWNVPAALSGAISCLFVREIADLRHFSPRIYAIYGWLALLFVVLTAANAAKSIGFGPWVNAAGNLIFLATAVFTLIVALLAWRRGSRAAGWFLLAWTLLEACTIATTVFLLADAPEDTSRMLYYFALPLSMVAAGVVIALGVADRLREQRLALSEAERRAQTDSLTGVLNRRSLVERLEAAGLRARARGLPLSILFIDLDHFKLINDSFGHPAGDACLRAIIAPIQAELRQSDVIGRWGGEEFVVMLSSADAAAAQPIAERIRTRVAEVRIEGFGAPIRMTCSIGIAASETEGRWGQELISRADEAVYAAKRSGRNQVRLAEAGA
ncbi:MAG: diguanylate cyclase [Steroidobacteraceae bacterium]